MSSASVIAKPCRTQLFTFALILCACASCLSELDQHFDVENADEPNLCLLQVRSVIVSKPLAPSKPLTSVEMPDAGGMREPPLGSTEVAIPNAPVTTAQEAPLRTIPEHGRHGRGQGPIELLSTKRQKTFVVGGLSLGDGPNQVVCLLVALAIPILFLLAYQFVLYPPDDDRYQSRRSSGTSAPNYNDGRPRSQAPTMQSPMSSYRVASSSQPGSTSGLVLGIPRALVPVAQEVRIDVLNLGADGSAVLSAVVSERKGRPGIWLLAASQAPVAWLDTSQALLDGGDFADPTPRRGLANEAGRCVVLHRAQNQAGSWMPSAWGGPPAPPNAPFAVLVLTRNEAGGILVAQRYSGGSQSGGDLLTVSLTPHGEVIAVNDTRGAVLATAEPGAAQSPSGSVKGSARVLLDSQAGNPSHTVVAVSPGADVVLVVAAVISAQKLHPHFSF